MSIYTEHGYANRREYLETLAERTGLPEQRVIELAMALGKEADFDGLVYVVRAESERAQEAA